ncbi:MAG: hypothetical protein ACR2IE_16240 [Candidatus Sumerlaeaceae bacterium]
MDTIHFVRSLLFIRFVCAARISLVTLLLISFGTWGTAAEKAAAKEKQSSDSPSKAKSKETGRTSTSSGLPEEALKRAEQAEKQLAADKPNEALITLTKLDHDFPGHAALSLRLAQVYDKQDMVGPALFFYRRYAKLAGDRAREEAQARLFALEVTPGATESAQSFAAKMGEPTAAAATPAPVARYEVAAARSDGSLVPLRGPEDVNEMVKSGGVQNMQTPVPSGPTPYVIPDESLQQAKAAVTGTAHAPTSGQEGLVLSGTGDHVTVRQAPGTAAHAPPAGTGNRNAGDKGVYAAGTPEQGIDEDAQLARAFSQGTGRAGQTTPVPQRTPNQGSLRVVPESTPIASATATYGARASDQPPPGVPARDGAVAYLKPTPVTDVVTARAEKFFTTKKISGSNATLKLFNDLNEAVMTLKIIPQEEGDAMNAILAKDENRTLQIPPGDYDVHVNIATTNYPPLTLLETHFAHKFEGGTQYLRRFNSDNIQQLR